MNANAWIGVATFVFIVVGFLIAIRLDGGRAR